jgi:hypothetical protein
MINDQVQAAMKEPPIITPPVKTKGSRFIACGFMILLAAFGFLIFLFYLGMPRPPKQSKLLQNFYAHRAAFEQLRDMLQADGNLSRVASWGVETTKPFFLGYPSENVFPLDRYKKYLALLKQTGGAVASRSEGEPADPSVMAWGWGFAGYTRHIGICWMEKAPTNQIASLDGFHNRIQYPRQIAYRHIDHNWYLWTDL